MGASRYISPEKFREYLEKHLGRKRKLSCIVVMACHSEAFVEIAKEFADFAVGIKKGDTIEDKAAEIFSREFYTYMLSGFSFSESATKARQDVNKAFKYCDCFPYYEDE